nr:hypothetical protein [Tanacetum cinerariifolium]
PTVLTFGQNYSNSTNPISVAGPLNSNTSPTHGKSSLRDAYQPPDILEREDIVYSDHENVGAEVDFNNLETSITNKEGDVAFDEKEHDAEKRKSAVNLSLSNSALLGEQDDITKKKDKGKRNQTNPSAGFQETFDADKVGEEAN